MPAGNRNRPDPKAARQLVGLALADVERELILATLVATNGNRTHAAAILEISVRALRYKLNEYAAEGVEIPPPPHGTERAELAT